MEVSGVMVDVLPSTTTRPENPRDSVWKAVVIAGPPGAKVVDPRTRLLPLPAATSEGPKVTVGKPMPGKPDGPTALALDGTPVLSDRTLPVLTLQNLQELRSVPEARPLDPGKTVALLALSAAASVVVAAETVPGPENRRLAST